MRPKSYKDNKQKKKLKNVLVLSSVQPLLGITKDDGKKKPAIIKLYDFTKIGTDIVDQRNERGSTKSKSNKWTKVAFSYVLDVSRNNALVVFSKATNVEVKKVNTFEFSMNLVKELITAHIQRRSLDGLNQPILAKVSRGRSTIGIEPLQGAVPQPPEAPISNTGPRRRCWLCLDELKNMARQAEGEPSKKDRKDTLPKSTLQCQGCGNSLCKSHANVLCQKCKD